jgi:hypothetical protein
MRGFVIEEAILRCSSLKVPADPFRSMFEIFLGK